MNEQTNKTEEYVEIDLQRIFAALWHKIWLVIVVAVVAAVLTLVVLLNFVDRKYEASTMFYVNNNDFSMSTATLDISSADLTAAKDLVKSYITILKTRKTLTSVIDYAEVDLTVSQIRGMISAESVNDTEIFEVVVTSTDPEVAMKVAQAIEVILPKQIDSVIDGTSARVVDSPIMPNRNSPSFPNYTKGTLIGFLAGFFLMAVIVVMQEVFDVTIRSEEHVQQVCNHPVLAAVPDMGAPSKGGYYYYGYGNKHRNPKSGTAGNSAPAVMGGNISFAAAEAYKLLRTKLQFSFADESASRVIGFSSALSGEGKSLSAVNLAYSLSQLDKKVLLIDCDMRRPTLAEKLNIRKLPGLSGYLTGQQKLEGLIQLCNLKNEENAFHVIAAGQNPPNPIELLSSDRMVRFLKELRTRYDYVILDLPPVGEVSDAMAVAKETDGMLLVVRQNYCDRVVLKDAVRQFDFINTRILGVVYNCASENSGRYGKSYYKKYYRHYAQKNNSLAGRRYEGAYVSKKTTDNTQASANTAEEKSKGL